MKRYSQYCGLARALDVVGDRWSMLIVRELSLRDCRYSDIRDGLPGVATNLLADRLRVLATAGVIERVDARPPVASPLYRLTDHGRELLPALYGLVQWATPMMIDGPGDDEQRGRWIAFAARAYLRDVPADTAPLLIAIESGDEPVSIAIDEHGTVTTTPRLEPGADIHIAGPAWPVMGLLSGQLDLTELGAGVTITASRSSRRRLQRLLAANRELAEAAR